MVRTARCIHCGRSVMLDEDGSRRPHYSARGAMCVGGTRMAERPPRVPSFREQLPTLQAIADSHRTIADIYLRDIK